MAFPRINEKSAQVRLPTTALVSSGHVARKGAWGTTALRGTIMLLYIVIGRNIGAEAGAGGAVLRRHQAPLALARPLSVPSHSASFPGRGSVMQLILKKDNSNGRTTTTEKPSSRAPDLSSASTFSPAATLSSVAAAAAAVVGRFTNPSTTSRSSSFIEETLLSSGRKVESSPYVSVEIRKPLIDELVSVVDLRLEVFCGQKYAAAHPEARERSLRQLVTRQRKGSTCLVASARDALDPSAERGTVVGSLELSTHEFEETSMSPSCDTTVPKLYVTEMAVSEGFRRRGVASGLLKAVDEHAKELGIPFICLFVETKNRSAIELYLKAGYHLVPYSPQAVAFASAIGLYSGALASREYYFAYKRLPIAQATPTSSMPVTLVGAGMERSVYGPASMAM